MPVWTMPSVSKIGQGTSAESDGMAGKRQQHHDARQHLDKGDMLCGATDSQFARNDGRHRIEEGRGHGQPEPLRAS